jgi:ubiquinone biosynthesis protein
VFAKNGFQNVAERLKLGRFVLERLTGPDVERFSAPERLRMAFEELGPTFVKFGQLLATRPDFIPEEVVEEFKRLHDQVAPIPFSEIEKVLERQFGSEIHSVFRTIDPSPLAAASIAQVHRAVLHDGTEVVVKVQRPGVLPIIRDDINILFFLAELLNRYIPESRVFNLPGMVEEFFQTLELETNFIIEANNIRRFRENFRKDLTIKIPHVYMEYSGKEVLVLEALQGLPLSNKVALDQEGVDRLKVMEAGIRGYFKMVFRDGLFHGDLHAGNLFILPDARIGLVDFGIVGRLNRRTQDAIANMFVALYQEDYERLAYEYVEIAPYSDAIDVDAFARDLQGLLGPYFGLSMKNVDLGLLLMKSTRVAAKHRVTLPSELMLFFKSIVTIEGMARMVMKDFDLLSYALEFASELVKIKYDPNRIQQDFMNLMRDSTGLLHYLPRQVKHLVRRLNHPDFAVRFSIAEVEDLKRSVETSSNLIFLGLIIGAMIVGGSMALGFKEGPYFLQMPAAAATLYSIAALLSLIAFRNYIRKL